MTTVSRRRSAFTEPSPKRAPGSSRTPRAQSAAAICFLPNALTSPEPDGVGAGADEDGVLADLELAGRRARRSVTVTGPSLSRSPSYVVQAPGAGVQARTWRSIATAGLGQSTRASSTVIFGREARRRPPAAAGPRATPSSMPSSVATSSPAPPSASRPSRSPAVSVGPDPLGHQPERRPGVELLDDPERRRAGDLVTGPDGVLDGRGAAPGGQHGEVQVDPAVRRDVERGLRQQGAVRDDRAAVGRERAQRGLELGVARVVGLEDRDAELLGALGDRAGVSLRPRPAGASGRVTTPTSSWADAATPRGRAAPTSGVPAKTTASRDSEAAARGRVRARP